MSIKWFSNFLPYRGWTVRVLAALSSPWSPLVLGIKSENILFLKKIKNIIWQRTICWSRSLLPCGSQGSNLGKQWPLFPGPSYRPWSESFLRCSPTFRCFWFLQKGAFKLSSWKTMRQTQRAPQTAHTLTFHSGVLGSLKDSMVDLCEPA